MQPSPQTASTSLPAPGGTPDHARRAEGLAYQALTIIAILMILGSVWLF
jgi:hypothetical protein